MSGPAPRRPILDEAGEVVQAPEGPPAPRGPLRAPSRRFVPPVVYECVCCGQPVVQLVTQGSEGDPVLQFGLCQRHLREWSASGGEGQRAIVEFVTPLQARLRPGEFMRGLIVYREPAP